MYSMNTLHYEIVLCLSKHKMKNSNHFLSTYAVGAICPICISFSIINNYIYLSRQWCDKRTLQIKRTFFSTPSPPLSISPLLSKAITACLQSRGNCVVVGSNLSSVNKVGNINLYFQIIDSELYDDTEQHSIGLIIER